jgi:hypothetical protein
LSFPPGRAADSGYRPVMTASPAPSARMGYLTVRPGLDLKDDKQQLNIVIELLIEEAKQRAAGAGLELLGEPMAMVVEGTAIAMDDPQAAADYTWGPSIGIFIEVHVRNLAAEDGHGEL